MDEFKHITYSGGYLPIEDHGLIGDGSTAALVGRDGAISWMRAPRFDSPRCSAACSTRDAAARSPSRLKA
jgi:GH15 family glucan-1,4-alpha-glucosidase